MGTVRCQVRTVGDQRIVDEIHKVVVHSFRMGDVEDPDLYAAEPLLKWQESEQGKFVMEHAVDTPVWHRQHDLANYGHQYVIVAELEKKKLSEFYLKWGKVNGNSTVW
jgi:hypothetical protein